MIQIVGLPFIIYSCATACRFGQSAAISCITNPTIVDEAKTMNCEHFCLVLEYVPLVKAIPVWSAINIFGLLLTVQYREQNRVLVLGS